MSQRRERRCFSDVVDSRAAPVRAVQFVSIRPSRPPAAITATGFERLFVAEYSRVTAIAARVLGEPAAAEDVAQEVFLDLHKRFGNDPCAQAPAWLHAAAVHTALNLIRSRRRRGLREERFAADASISEDPQAAVEAAETRTAIRAALARVPARDASVLALRYSGLSYAETAAALGIGVSGVGTRLRRAEARLRKEVGDASL
jgi:RNA polymerase sigma factor (sigma-70 family)